MVIDLRHGGAVGIQAFVSGTLTGTWLRGIGRPCQTTATYKSRILFLVKVI